MVDLKVGCRSRSCRRTAYPQSTSPVDIRNRGFMTPGISLCLVFHNHQPVGNFGWVFRDLWDHSYEPMLAALEARPTFRAGLHYSGPLLDWMEAEEPDSIQRIRELVEREQVELLGSGL